MFKYRILFSKTNTEARFLAALLQKKIMGTEISPVLFKGKPTAAMTEYNREVDYVPSFEAEDSHVVGVEMHPVHLLRELQQTLGLVHIYAYDEQCEGLIEKVRVLGKLDDTQVDRIILHKNMTTTQGKKQLLPGDSVDMYSPFHFLVLGDWLGSTTPTMALEAARIMHEYQNLDPLDRSQLVSAHDNLHELDLCDMEAGREFVPRVWAAKHPLADKFKELLIKRSVTAKHIERTLRNQYIGSQQKGRMLLNMSIPREHAVYAARLLSYAHDRFMMYEDGNNHRLWTIVAPTVYEAKGLAELLKPHDVWSEKRFVYAITDLPKIA